MVGKESEAQQLTVGSEVEVTSDEEGFRGAWYGATILEPIPKSSAKKKRKVLVQYKNLVTEDGSELLKEHVDLAHLRPLPPPDLKPSFEVDDVIDAFYQDGWWTGVILKQLGSSKSSKFMIFFDNPPDIIESEATNLRNHVEWVNGKWVPSIKQKQVTGSIFSPGTLVEVRIQRDDMRGAWFPITFVKQLEEDIFLVKHLSSKDDTIHVFPDEPLFTKLAVVSEHIRPAPPRYVTRSYELLEKVEAYYDLAWRAGLITKVLGEGRYLVFFKHGNNDKEFGQSEVRPIVEWIDGKWVGDSKKDLVASDHQENLGHSRKNGDLEEAGFQLGSSGSVKDRIGKKKSSVKNSRKDLTEIPTPSTESSLSDTLTQSTKKLKLTASNSNATNSQPSKKVSPQLAEPTLSVTVFKSRKMAVKTPSKEGGPLSDTLSQSTKKLKLTASNSNATNSQPSKKVSPKLAEPPLSVTVFKSRKMAVKTPSKEGGGVSPTAGTGSRSIKRPFAGDQLSTITKSPTKKQFRIRQMKLGERDDEMNDTERRIGVRLKKPSVKYSTTSAAGKNETTGTNRTDVVIALESPVTKGSNNGNHGQLPDDILIGTAPLKSPKKLLTDPSGNKSGEIELQKIERSSQKRKRGRPRKLVVSTRDTTTCNNDGGVGGSTDEVGKECPNAYEVVNSWALSTWIGGAKQVNKSDKEVNEANKPADKSGKEVNESVEQVEKTIKEVNESSPSPSNFTKGENQRLPFVKSSPVWKTIESMEVFHVMPQDPHFHPLIECKEEYREGSAIGNMITFANLVEKTSKLQLDDPTSAFDSILETLLHLEKHGFEVKPLQAGVNQLLSLKSTEQHHRGELKDLESKILQHADERNKYASEMDEIAKKIRDLQEKHATIKSKHDIVDTELVKLQTRSETICESTRKAHADFKKTRGAPWKLT